MQFLQKLGDFPGVLPLLDAHLPERPKSTDRAWLATLAEIAETLARLAERGAGHRDIKPGNLYELAGRWLIGDFRLVAGPDLVELTVSGKKLGPAHYTANELILDRSTPTRSRPTCCLTASSTGPLACSPTSAASWRWRRCGGCRSCAGHSMTHWAVRTPRSQLDSVGDRWGGQRPAHAPQLGRAGGHLRRRPG